MKLILGTTPIAFSVIDKWRDYEVRHCYEDSLPPNLNGCDELFIALRQSDPDSFRSDSENIAKILPLLDTYDPDQNEGTKLLCHLLLYSQTTCDSFRNSDLKGELNGKVEIWPFTMEDITARKITFDRNSIPLESGSTVHLVIFGMTQWTEAIAKYATIACHYPNYTRDHSLRTRITIIDDDIVPESEAFAARYRHLFNNSYIRFVDVNGQRSKVSRPQYSRTREDFVDMEWEFVQGTPDNEVFAEKLGIWAADAGQQLTVAVCYEDDERNIALAGRMKDIVNDASVPVYVKVNDSSIFQALNMPGCIKPLCADDAGYDITLPERRMAQIVNCFYRQAYDTPEGRKIQTPMEVDMAAARECWEDLAADLRWSSVCSAMSIRSKMHSLGHDESDWGTFYSVSAREIECIAKVEHNRWSVEKLMTGYRPLTDEEQKAVVQNPGLKKVLKQQKAHYDLRSYDEIGKDETGKNSQIYDIVITGAIPLIANASKDKSAKSEEDKR